MTVLCGRLQDNAHSSLCGASLFAKAKKRELNQKARAILQAQRVSVIDHSTRVLWAWHWESRSTHEGVHVSTLRSALIWPAIEQSGSTTDKKKNPLKFQRSLYIYIYIYLRMRTYTLIRASAPSTQTNAVHKPIKQCSHTLSVISGM